MVIPSDLSRQVRFQTVHFMIIYVGWLQMRHGICNPAWGWDRILVHAAGSESGGYSNLAVAVFEEFRSELDRGIFKPDFPLDWTPEPEQTCTQGYHDV